MLLSRRNAVTWLRLAFSLSTVCILLFCGIYFDAMLAHAIHTSIHWLVDLIILCRTSGYAFHFCLYCMLLHLREDHTIFCITPHVENALLLFLLPTASRHYYYFMPQHLSVALLTHTYPHRVMFQPSRSGFR